MPDKNQEDQIDKTEQALLSAQNDCRIIAVVNQKGGVGKTTTAVNLATALAAVNMRVLIVDLDPQGNASTGFGIARQERRRGGYEMMFDGLPVEDVASPTMIPNLSIVTSTADLAGAEIQLVGMEGRESRLKKALDNSAKNYDYIIIDCPPSLNLLTLNALVAAHSLLVPMQPEFYALEGISNLLQTVEAVRQRFNPALEIEGVVLTMFDRRNALTLAVEQDVRKFLGDKVFDTTIPRNVRISEAPSHGKPVLLYDLKCSGSRAYMMLASEMLRREGRDLSGRGAAHGAQASAA